MVREILQKLRINFPLIISYNIKWNFIIKDHLGSTRMVLNSGSTIDTRYNYAPFGRVMYSTVTTDIAYKFTGQEYDDEFGLHNFRARLYDAELSMLYAYDPAAQGFSPFGYAGNNPVLYIDKDGRIFGIDDLVFVGILALGGAINTAIHWNDISNTEGNFWDKLGKGFSFFGVGSLSAFTAIIPGGGFVAVGGSSLLNLYGNSFITGEDVMPTDIGISLVTSGLFYGIGNISRGGSFFDNWVPTFSSKTPAEQIAENAAKSLGKDKLPPGIVDIQRPKYNIIGDGDKLLTKTDPFHNFNLKMQLKTIDEGIWSQTTRMRFNFFELKGTFDLNGKIYNGVYQMGIKPWGEIFHRAFIPWDKFPSTFILKSNGNYSIPRLLPFNF